MRFRLLLLGLCPALLLVSGALGEPLKLHLRSQQKTDPQAGKFQTVVRIETWEPRETAIVVCDMWDSHTCPNAAQRVAT